jgi:hypothetical protein
MTMRPVADIIGTALDKALEAEIIKRYSIVSEDMLDGEKVTLGRLRKGMRDLADFHRIARKALEGIDG